MTEARIHYERLLRKLHDLYLQGLEDSEEYERICDEGDAFWYKMTEEEMEEIKKMSIDLYVESKRMREEQ